MNIIENMNKDTILRDSLYVASFIFGLYASYELICYTSNTIHDYIVEEGKNILCDMLNSDDVQIATSNFIDKTLQNKNITDNVTILLKNQLEELLNDEIVINKLTELLLEIIEKNDVQTSINSLVETTINDNSDMFFDKTLTTINNDANVRHKISRFLKHQLNKIITDETIKENLHTLLLETIQKPELIDSSKNIVNEFLNDEDVYDNVENVCHNIIENAIVNDELKHKITAYVEHVLFHTIKKNSFGLL